MLRRVARSFLKWSRATTTRRRATRILEWQTQQEIPVCPTPDDPGACNPYTELQMPDDVLADIEAYRERQFDAEEAEVR